MKRIVALVVVLVVTWGFALGNAQMTQNEGKDLVPPILPCGAEPFGYASINLFDNNTLIADAYTHFEFFDAETFQQKTVMENPPYGLLTQLEDGWCVVRTPTLSQYGLKYNYLYQIIPSGKRLLSKYHQLYFINPNGDYIVNDEGKDKSIYGFTSQGQWVLKYSDFGKYDLTNSNTYVFGERAILTAESKTIIIDTIKGSILLVVESRCCQFLKVIKGIAFFNKLAIDLESAKVLFQYDYYPSVVKVNENNINLLYYTYSRPALITEVYFESRDFTGKILERCQVSSVKPWTSNPNLMGFMDSYIYGFSYIYFRDYMNFTPCLTIQNAFDPSDRYDFIVQSRNLTGFNACDNGKDLFIWCEGWVARLDIRSKSILSFKSLSRSSDLIDNSVIGKTEIDGFVGPRKLALYDLKQSESKSYYDYLLDKPNFVVPLNGGYYVFPNIIDAGMSWPIFCEADKPQRTLVKQVFKGRMLWASEYRGKPICLLQDDIDMRLLVLEESKMKEVMHWYVMKDDQPGLFLKRDDLLFFCIGNTHYLTDLVTLKFETINHYLKSYQPIRAILLKNYVITIGYLTTFFIDIETKKSEIHKFEYFTSNDDVAIFRQNGDLCIFDGKDFKNIEDFFTTNNYFMNLSWINDLYISDELIYDRDFKKLQAFPKHSEFFYSCQMIEFNRDNSKICFVNQNYYNPCQNELYSIIDVSKANSFSVTKTESELDETYQLELTLEDGQKLSGKAYLTKSSSSNWLDDDAKSIDFVIDKQSGKVSIEVDKEYDQVIFDCSGLLDVEKSKLEDGQEHPMFEGSSIDYRTQRALTITRWKN